MEPSGSVDVFKANSVSGKLKNIFSFLLQQYDLEKLYFHWHICLLKDNLQTKNPQYNRLPDILQKELYTISSTKYYK